VAVAPVLLPGSVTVEVGSPLQTIQGWGAADVFLSAIPSAYLDLFFSPTLGIGLTFLRTGIAPDGTVYGNYANSVGAAARGAQIWAAPWTAPASYKSNDSYTNGGSLLVADYSAWASTMAGFASAFPGNTGGLNLYAVSVQNEPDQSPGYVSMTYTAAQMTAFIDVLGPALAAVSPTPLLMMPEMSAWGGVSAYTAAVAADSTAKSYTAIVAAHQYSGYAAPDGNLPSLPIWQTEMSYFSGFDASMNVAITMAEDIYNALVTGGVSAWHYWWLVGVNNDNEGLIGYSGDPNGNDPITAPTITKRLYALGNYSKFVRPGYLLLTITGSVSGCYPTAFKAAAGNAFAIVVINTNNALESFYIAIPGMAGTAVVPWITDPSNNLVAQASVPIVSGRFLASLTAMSVTTFVGTGL
jgi:glucuronoarabinoxylan endo-1,4-beta-xylanase